MQTSNSCKKRGKRWISKRGTGRRTN